MPLRVYHKAGLEFPKPTTSFHLRLLPTLTSAAGLLLIAFVVWPILSYEFKTNSSSSNKNESGLLSPVINISQPTYSPRVIGSFDYTKPQNWFPHDQPSQPKSTEVAEYILSIPKLRIEKAKVIIGGKKLEESLVHYPNTALPGQLGSPVIFGHSILPQFYDPNNYLSIFSLLPNLDQGDKIFVNFEDVTYTYQVTEKQEVFPDDLWVLRQKYDSKRLKLITCVPPGLKSRRLVITAKLISS